MEITVSIPGIHTRELDIYIYWILTGPSFAVWTEREVNDLVNGEGIVLYISLYLPPKNRFSAEVFPLNITLTAQLRLSYLMIIVYDNEDLLRP